MECTSSLAGNDRNYAFRELSISDPTTGINRQGLQGYIKNTKPMFANLANRWSPELHSEWFQRNFFALKLIIGASLQFGSAEHAHKQNLHMAVPYLSYYGMFNAVRANLVSSPRFGWGKNSLLIRHKKVIEKYSIEIGLYFSPREVRGNVELFIEAKQNRELFSYKFPGSGAKSASHFFDAQEKAEKFARIAAELALLNTFCLEDAILERFGPEDEWAGFETDIRLLSPLWTHMLKDTLGKESRMFVDDEDRYLAEKLAGSIRRPVTLVNMMTKADIKSTFEAFGSTTSDTIGFNPLEHRNRLLQL